MELTINIKDQKYISTFLKLIKDIDYLEIIRNNPMIFPKTF